MATEEITLSIEWTFSVVSGTSITDEDLVGHVNQVMEELVKLEDAGCPIADAALSLDTGNQTVLVELIATGPTYPEAANQGLSSIRAAIHAAGGHTGKIDWQSLADILVPGEATMSTAQPVEHRTEAHAPQLVCA